MSTNQGLVNVADQAFPPVLGGNTQVVPRNNGNSLNPAIGPQLTPPLAGNFTATSIPSVVNVINVPPPQFPLGLGTVIPPATNVNLMGQGRDTSNDKSFIITEAGSIEVDQSVADVDYTITAVFDADTGAAVTGTTIRLALVIDFTTKPLLTSYGITMVGRTIDFVQTVDPSLEGSERTVASYAPNGVIVFLVEGGSSLPSIPQVGDVFEIETARKGAEVMFQNTGVPVTSTPTTLPYLPPSPIAIQKVQKDSDPNEVVVGTPYIGQGVSSPTATNVNVNGPQGTPSFTGGVEGIIRTDKAYNPSMGSQPTPPLEGNAVFVPTPRTTNVIFEAPAQLPLGAGTVVPKSTSVNLADDTLSPGNVKDFVITEAGSIEINQAEAYVEYDILRAFDLDTGGAVTVSTTKICIVVSDQTLSSYGVTMVGRSIEFTSTISPTLDGLSRKIIAYSAGSVTVLNDEGSGSLPATITGGDQFEINTARQGAEPVTQPTSAPVDVTPQTFPVEDVPPEAIQISQPDSNPSETFVGEPYIGGGSQVPTAVEVYVSKGKTGSSSFEGGMIAAVDDNRLVNPAFGPQATPQLTLDTVTHEEDPTEVTVSSKAPASLPLSMGSPAPSFTTVDINQQIIASPDPTNVFVTQAGSKPTGSSVNVTPETNPVLDAKPITNQVFQGTTSPANEVVGKPPITGGEEVPTAITVNVIDQAPPKGIPPEVFP